MPNRALPIFTLVTLVLIAGYWWVSRPAEPIAGFSPWLKVFEALAADDLMLKDVQALTDDTLSADENNVLSARFASHWHVRVAVKPDVPEQVAELNLIPAQSFTEAQLQATLGEPRLRLELAQGLAWVYPPRGLTLYFQEGHLRLLEAIPAKVFSEEAQATKSAPQT